MQDDARTLFPVLAALHALATELAVPRFEPADLGRLRRENDAHVTALMHRDGPAAYASDDRFHDVFVERLGQRRDRARRSSAWHRACAGSSCSTRGRCRGAARWPSTRRSSTGRGHGDAPGAANAARENWLTFGAQIERSLAPPAA